MYDFEYANKNLIYFLNIYYFKRMCVLTITKTELSFHIANATYIVYIFSLHS